MLQTENPADFLLIEGAKDKQNYQEIGGQIYSEAITPVYSKHFIQFFMLRKLIQENQVIINMQQQKKKKGIKYPPGYRPVPEKKFLNAQPPTNYQQVFYSCERMRPG